jgi:hypothetical protein
MDQKSARKKRKRTNRADIFNNRSSMLTKPNPKRSKHSKTRARQEIDCLCQDCAEIYIDNALLRKSPTFRGTLIKKLGRNPQWDIESCSLCRWLAITDKFTFGRYRPLKLRYYSSKKMDMGWKSVDINMLGLSPYGPFLVPYQKGAGVVRRLKPSSIDFGLLRSWLHLCDEMHTKSCAVKESPSVPFMKLIDCYTKTIVPAKNHRYVTLSYGWGSSPGPTEYLESLPKRLPYTIRDSIRVTRKLGFPYLWID